MELYRYSINKLSAITCPSEDYIFSIARNVLRNITKRNLGKIHPKARVVYLTPRLINEANYAQDKLALTYSPMYVSILKPDVQDSFINNEGDIIGLANGWILRSWPAFGHSGGAPEILLKCDELGTVNFERISPILNGGRLDPFIMDLVSLPYNDTLLIVRALILAFAQSSSEFEEDEYGPLKVKMTPSEIVLKFEVRGVNVSLSFSYFIFDQSTTIVRVFETTWYDDEPLRTRHMLDNLDRYFALSYTRTKKGIPNRIQPGTPGFDLLRNSVIDIMSEATSNIRNGTFSTPRVSDIP